jgi:hypothetical protein
MLSPAHFEDFLAWRTSTNTASSKHESGEARKSGSTGRIGSTFTEYLQNSDLLSSAFYS